jgi:hypothetical protein
MPRGNSDAAVYRPDLGMAVIEYAEGVTMPYIGLEVMPLYYTIKQAATYPVIPKEALLSIPDTSRAPRGKYNRGDWEYERGKFSTSENGWEEPVDDSERELVEGEVPGLADFVATKRAWNHIMRGQEKRVADKVFNASNFTANAITHEWDDASNAVPIDDTNTGKMSIRSACGMLPNTMIMAYSTFENLKNCDQIVDRLKYTFAGIDINKMTTQQLAAVFNIERVLVGGAVYNSAGKGLAASISDLWSNEYAMLTITAKNQEDVTEPCIGRTFLWTEDSAQNPIVEEYREEQTRSDVFRVRHNTDEAFMQSVDSSGTAVSEIHKAVSYLFSNVTT